MVGAIEFMRAWRDMCESLIDRPCADCPAHSCCPLDIYNINNLKDETINKLISTVMAWKTQKEVGK